MANTRYPTPISTRNSKLTAAGIKISINAFFKVFLNLFRIDLIRKKLEKNIKFGQDEEYFASSVARAKVLSQASQNWQRAKEKQEERDRIIRIRNLNHQISEGKRDKRKHP